LSTEASVFGQRVSRAAGLSLVTLAATASHAAEVDFRPTLTFGAYYDGNTAVVGEAGFDRTTPESTLNFSYRPSYVAYRNASDLNYFGQSADLNFARSASRSARYTFDLNAYRTERQGVRPTSPSDPATFVPRSMHTHVGARAHGTHEGRRNLIDWEVRGHLDDYSLSTLENSSGLGALVAWRYEVSEKSSVGLGLNFDTLMYQTLPNVYIESFGLVGEREFTRSTSMVYAAGVSRTSSEGSSSTNFAADVSVSRAITDVSALSAGVRQSVSAGSGLGGTSLDTGGYVSYSHTAPRRGLGGSVVAGYWRRDPMAVGAAAATASTTTLSAGGSLGWNFNRFLALNFAYAYSDQTSSDPATLDTRYSSYGLNLLWTIRGR
jgi:hypothetical protein